MNERNEQKNGLIKAAERFIADVKAAKTGNEIRTAFNDEFFAVWLDIEPGLEDDGSNDEGPGSGEAKFYEVEVPDYNTLYVGVDAGQEGVWADTQRYLKDVGVEFTVKENKTPVYGKDGKILSPGELSDLLAPRDV